MCVLIFCKGKLKNSETAKQRNSEIFYQQFVLPFLYFRIKHKNSI